MPEILVEIQIFFFCYIDLSAIGNQADRVQAAMEALQRAQVEEKIHQENKFRYLENKP